MKSFGNVTDFQYSVPNDGLYSTAVLSITAYHYPFHSNQSQVVYYSFNSVQNKCENSHYFHIMICVQA